MNKDTVDGNLKQVKGSVKEALGKVTGNKRLEVEGAAEKLAGKAQQGYGAVLDQVRESAVVNPVATLAVVASVSFVLGALWAKR